MFIQDIKTIIAIELKKLASSLPEDQNTANDLIKAFEESLKVGKEEKPLKVKRQTVLLDNDIRCLALKKDGSRCNGRRKIEGTLCPIHQRTGVKFGSYIQDDDDSGSSSVAQVTPKIKKTKAVIKSEKEVIAKILHKEDSDDEEIDNEEIDNEDTYQGEDSDNDNEDVEREEFEF